jgi:hypothetical protein
LGCILTALVSSDTLVDVKYQCGAEMPEHFKEQEAEPTEQTCLGGKKQGKIQGNSESGWKSRALASLEPMFRAFLPIRRQRITGKAICDNRAMHRQKQGKLRPSWSVNTRALPLPARAALATRTRIETAQQTKKRHASRYLDRARISTRYITISERMLEQTRLSRP